MARRDALLRITKSLLTRRTELRKRLGMELDSLNVKSTAASGDSARKLRHGHDPRISEPAMSIDTQDCETIERARNVAFAWLEQNGVRFENDLARLTSPLGENWGTVALYRDGIEFGLRPRCRLRLEYAGGGQGAFEVDIDGRRRRRLTFRADAALSRRLAVRA